jgi:HlyD family secretion protein
MFKLLGNLFLPAAAAGMVSFATYHVAWTSRELPRPELPVEPARAPYPKTVAGSGLVEARTENIAIGSALSGVILEVYVPAEQVGKHVAAGAPLFRVDDRHLRAQLTLNEANLAAAEAQLAKLEAAPRAEELPPSEARVRAALANVALLKDKYQRTSKLVARQAATIEEGVERKLALEVGRQQLAQARTEYALLRAGSWAPDKATARAAVAQARAQVEQAKTEVERALVRAPADGDVLQVNVRAGESVGTQPGQALIVLGNVRTLHVRADIDEDDIPRFRPGSPARASLRGDSRIVYPLRFVRVEPFVIPKKSLTGDNTERVDTRVLQVIYEVDAADKLVYVGQQLDVFIESNVSPPALTRYGQ